MIKHVCIRTGARFDPEWYVAHKDQPKTQNIEHGTFFDNIEDAQDLQKRMKDRWPNETFEVFTVIKR